jgi:hypothetical protein
MLFVDVTVFWCLLFLIAGTGLHMDDSPEPSMVVVPPHVLLGSSACPDWFLPCPSTFLRVQRGLHDECAVDELFMEGVRVRGNFEFDMETPVHDCIDGRGHRRKK